MVISTIKELCRQCYACVRNCPVKAVKIEKGQAEVIESRCIECGNCLKVCSQKAKKVLDSRDEVLKLLKSEDPVSIILAPSFVSSFHLENPLQLNSALIKLGFRDVWTAALGAQLLVNDYKKLVDENEMTISSPCPAVVSMVEKHFPSLLKYLAPLVSPMVATARYIRTLYPGRKIVFAGPCIAKKGEIQQYLDLIRYALTFKELKDLLEGQGIKPDGATEEKFSGPTPFYGQLIPLSGGLAQMLNLPSNIMATDIIHVDGEKECYQTLEAISSGRLKAKLVDMLMCRGCIDGPAIDGERDYYNRKKAVINYFNSISVFERIKGKEAIAAIRDLDLSREMSAKKVVLPQPAEEDIRRILASTGKHDEGDLINCGACGYNSCREKAIAVYQGIAEVEMCLPYLLEKKTKLLEELDMKFRTIEELNRELDGIVETSYDGICVTDGKGIIQNANKAFKHLYGIAEELVGTYAGELEERNLAYPSATLLVMKEKRPVTFVQKIHNGRNLLVTGTPIFSEDGSLSKILINSRDFEELEKIKNKFDRTLQESEKLKKNLGTENIIAYSVPMAKILETCRKIARVDSTVLISGESGVGKEVIATYIHNISGRKDGPWVKINCGSIPDTLIESELFGYESGAFTGAKREGKIGLFELAHKGTIFLDEVGELPFNLQVKLLQVLQEKCIIRIGGTKPIQVDIRIIAATNRNLEEMVAKGKFRQDLFYRLNVVPILVPPLRNRKDDIVPLANYFLELYNKKYGVNKKLSREILQVFMGYDWPGNIRELTNLVERLVVTSDQPFIDMDNLPSYLTDKTMAHSLEGIPKLQEAVERLEREILQKAFALYGNSYKMAEVLGVNQSTVVRKMQKYGIS